jgi:hypothetical protein
MTEYMMMMMMIYDKIILLKIIIWCHIKYEYKSLLSSSYPSSLLYID